MRRAQYTRYALRLEPPVGARPSAAPVPAASTAVGADPDDDWSGDAATRTRPEAVLEYRHPEAVGAIVALQPAGWQEEDGGDTLVFWLEDGAEAEPGVAEKLSGIGARGRLEVSRQTPGWEDAWRRFHTPREIGRLYVRPPWYPPRDDLLDVVVEVGLAFGTGGHASTRQCLEEIQSIPLGSLLDLGSGSGVVSFAALRLGFAPVWGVDIDAVAVHAAAGNAARNGLAPTFMVGDATDPGYLLPAADVVVANIALRPILRLAVRWRGEGGRGMQPPTHVLLAGLLVAQEDEAVAAFPGYRVAGRRDDGTWLTAHLVRRP